ncbi:porin [Agrobacterium larrymoorei]|uniref:porin n=1 Tax=Agrobacterium larrymoorei TaxID=160699 RepID=UPI0015732F44|nr:porin [Agrobacterium larrymoorei]NTJ41957.1 porin [Agrobacterium larrymoorei]
MNIKSLLIGSAAALAAVSGAQAADAIVAAEPEPLEYVRVCDAFGTGFFYIPGTETCLKFGGYIRFQTDFGRDESGSSDWDSFTRAQFEVDTRTDTELGALRGFIGFRGNADSGSAFGNGGDDEGSGFHVNQAFIELGGLKVGKFYSEWDNDLSGETDILSTNSLFNSIAYTYDAGSFYGTLSVDELEGTLSSSDNNVGITGVVGAKFGAVTATVVGSYDTDLEEGAVRGIIYAEIGPGTLGVSGVWASGANAYYAESEWAVAAEYALKATDKLTITPAAQYLGNVDPGFGDAGVSLNSDWSNNDAWTAGLTVDYQITDGLKAKVAANYYDEDGSDDEVTGLVRLQRDF